MRFIASIAHDLRNPLSSISIVSQMLIAHSKEKEQELSRMIYRQVKNLDRLVSDLLDTIRIEAGQMNLSVSVQDIGLLVKDSVDIYRAGSGLHGLVTEIHGEPLLCECDGGRISQVINNLLSNAVKYSPNGGTVNVKGWKEREEIKFSVSDQGIGIDAQDIESIFQPFQRAKATRETIPGIGLGLSASKRLMEAHSGKLEVSSTPGKGSTFTVTLPVRSEIKRILPDESSKHLSAPTGTA
jgi:signal transduction histidine kinase